MIFPITTRLLCAAQQTYEITAVGLAPDSPATRRRHLPAW
jgi:hypothetical protein